MGNELQTYGSLRAVGRNEDLAYRVSAGYTRYPRGNESIDRRRVDLYTFTDDQKTASQNYRFDAQATRRFGKNTTLDVGGGYSAGLIDISGIGMFYDMVLDYERETSNAEFKTDNFRARVYYDRFAVHTGMNANYIGQTSYDSTALSTALDSKSSSSTSTSWARWATRSTSD